MQELGAWTGFTGPNGDGGYYARTAERRRYLWMDGHDSPSSYNMVQLPSHEPRGLEAVRWTMAALLALAKRTGRIFVMPKIWVSACVRAVFEISIDGADNTTGGGVGMNP